MHVSQTMCVRSSCCIKYSTCSHHNTPDAGSLSHLKRRPTAALPFDHLAPRRPLLLSNPGGNSRKCSPCPGGLSTKATATANVQDCLAPAGYYQLQGKAVAVSSG
jgi:hypothetical protein